MFKSFLEGFAIGVIFKALGQSVTLWILGFLVLASFGSTLLFMHQNGTDFTLLGVVLGYIWTVFSYLMVFVILRFLLKNKKHLTLFLIFMAIICYQHALFGGSYLSASAAFVSVLFALGIVYMIDKWINKLKNRKQNMVVS